MLAAAGVPQPIGHAATFSEWCNEDVAGALYPSKCTKWAAVAQAVDFMSLTAIAWWQNTVVPPQFPCISAENAAAWHVARLQEVRQQGMPPPPQHCGWQLAAGGPVCG